MQYVYLVLHVVSLGSVVTKLIASGKSSVFMLERNEFSWVNLSAFLPMFYHYKLGSLTF